jgi:hypothetical protein
VTIVVPTGNVAPGRWVDELINAPVQLSAAVGGVQETVLPQVVLPVPVWTIILAGHPDITGAVLSVTVMVNLQMLLLLLESVKV